MPPNTNQIGFSTLKQDDLKDPQLFRLNQAFLYLHGKVVSLIGAGNPTVLSAPTFNTAKAFSQTVPTAVAPTEFVTRASADQLYQTIQDTHANRLTRYVIQKYPLGTWFREADRHYIYILSLVAAVPAWVYASGKMLGPIGARPADLGVNDAGAEFFNSSAGFQQNLWTGTGWVQP